MRPTIVLLHGAWASSHMFRELIPRLAPRFHVIAPDLIGFGYSEAPSPERFGYTFDHLTHVLDRFLRQLGISRYILYMQDYGGPVGFRLAQAHPERVAGLVIQNANAYLEGFSPDALHALKPLWTERTSAAEAAARAVFAPEGIRFSVPHRRARPRAGEPGCVDT